MREMSGTKDDSRCQKAVRIVTELCQKKSLPSLDLDICREFLLLPSDQSLIISEPGTVLRSCLLEQCLQLPTAGGRQEDSRKGGECLQAPRWTRGDQPRHASRCGCLPLHVFRSAVLGASPGSPVDGKWCS